MTLRLKTWERRMEFVFGALLPTVVLLVPFLLSYPVIVILHFIHNGPLTPGNSFLAFMSLVGMFWMISSWLLVLSGASQINQHITLRWFVIVTVTLGLIEALLAMWGYVFGEGRFVFLLLIGPMVVGFRYLPKLLRGTQ